MMQVTHIAKKKEILKKRAAVLSALREFFVARNILEVTSPTLLRYPGQEPNIEPMRVLLEDERETCFKAYLHTSPEYTLKKCLAAGMGEVYSMGPVYRNRESFGGLHNPEFTLLEWYRPDADMYTLMDDVEALCHLLAQYSDRAEFFVAPLERRDMREVWKKYVGVNLNEYLTQEEMYALAVALGYAVTGEMSYEALFYTIFLDKIEPHLGVEGPCMIYHYPAAMAALSALSETDLLYAERTELYIDGKEIANGFTELTDATEQRARFVREQQEREVCGLPVYPIDEEFLAAVETLPACAGIAFGVDRFLQVLFGCQNIDDVIVLPASKLFLI